MRAFFRGSVAWKILGYPEPRRCSFIVLSGIRSEACFEDISFSEVHSDSKASPRLLSESTVSSWAPAFFFLLLCREGCCLLALLFYSWQLSLTSLYWTEWWVSWWARRRKKGQMKNTMFRNHCQNQLQCDLEIEGVKRVRQEQIKSDMDRVWWLLFTFNI